MSDEKKVRKTAEGEPVLSTWIICGLAVVLVVLVFSAKIMEVRGLDITVMLRIIAIDIIAMLGVGGIHSLSTSVRYRVRILASYDHTNKYGKAHRTSKNLLKAVFNYEYNGMEFTGETVNNITPVRYVKYIKGGRYPVWIDPEHPERCCSSRLTMFLLGILMLASAIAIILFWIWQYA